VTKVTCCGSPLSLLTLVTYKEYYKHWNFDDIYENGALVQLGQTVFDFETQIVPPGETLLTVDMPGCATQVDLVCGPVHEYLGDGNLYGSRKLAWYHAHEKINNQEVWCDDGIDAPVEQPCQLSIAEVTGISVGERVDIGQVLNIGALIEGGTAKKVVFKLTDDQGQPVPVTLWNGNEVPPEGHTESQSPYYFLGDGNVNGSGQPNGWDTTDYPMGQYTLEVLVYDNSHSSACDRISVPFELRQPTDKLLDDEEPLLATLLDFAARAHQQSILLEWTTAVEINNVGFCLWRAYKDHNGDYQVNGHLLVTKADDFKGASYAHQDKAVASGITYYYGLESISFGHTHKCTPQMTTLEALKNKEFLSIDSAIIDE
ncbi:MAG: hypothetical protein SVR94_01120, partial [Pseudomonadota bacterium]|nr:hypothetical protein [Pseudomonadota bacterium]